MKWIFRLILIVFLSVNLYAKKDLIPLADIGFNVGVNKEVGFGLNGRYLNIGGSLHITDLQQESHPSQYLDLFIPSEDYGLKFANIEFKSYSIIVTADLYLYEQDNIAGFVSFGIAVQESYIFPKELKSGVYLKQISSSFNHEFCYGVGIEVFPKRMMSITLGYKIIYGAYLGMGFLI